jgi:hypothetical protein
LPQLCITMLPMFWLDQGMLIRNQGFDIDMRAVCVGMLNEATGDFDPSPEQPCKPSCALMLMESYIKTG